MSKIRLLTLVVALAVTCLLPHVVLAQSHCDMVSRNLVVNCGFETGDFAGWNLDGDQSFSSVDRSNPHSGTWATTQGAVGDLGGFDQTVSTVSGNTYTLSFWLYSDGAIPNEFQAFWNGSLIMDSLDMPTFPYTEFTFSNLLATGTSTNIEFLFRNDNGFLWFDDVSVVPSTQVIPEPGTILLLGTGLVGMGGAIRRCQLKRKSQVRRNSL